MKSAEFVNQFIITEINVEHLYGWKNVRAGKYMVFAHPSLEVNVVTEDDNSLIVLGSWYDFRNPNLTNAAIAARLKINGSLADLVGELQYLCGVYLVIWVKNNEVILIPDMCALREVYYYKNELSTVIATSPNLMKYAGSLLQEDETPFYTSPAFKKNRTWVGDKTRFTNVFRLKPNHILRVSSGQVERFFPYTKLERKSLKEVAPRAATVLSGIMKAIVTREEKLMVNLTAGWDSRMLLSAGRDFYNQLMFVVCSRPGVPPYDEIVPRRLAQKLGFTLLNVRYDPKSTIVDRELLEQIPIFTENHLKTMHPIFKGFTTLTGSVSEIARTFYKNSWAISGGKLAALAGYEKESFAVEVYQEWLRRNRQLFESMNYSIMDMFYWEERVANSTTLAISLGHAFKRNILPPFNCHYLMELLLSVDPKLRRSQSSLLYTAIIKILWSEVLREPINPSRKKMIIRAMERMGIYNFYRTILSDQLFRPALSSLQALRARFLSPPS